MNIRSLHSLIAFEAFIYVYLFKFDFASRKNVFVVGCVVCDCGSFSFFFWYT